jgi:hypothetical protein
LRSPAMDGGEILRCAQNDRDGGYGTRGDAGGAEPRPYGVDGSVGGGPAARRVVAPYGVDGGAAMDLRGVGDAAPYGSTSVRK